MMSPAHFTRLAFAAFCGAALCGCLPSGQGRLDEEKEPHFLAGRSRVNAMDYRGAIEAFDEALQANPHSAAAHFELGWLFEEKESDPAAAIYHYEQFLKLRPSAENAETIRHRIFGLKQVLAQAVLPMPATPGIQREMEQLAEDNRRLREELDKWRAFGASRGSPTNPPASPTTVARPAANAGVAQTSSSSTSQQTTASTGRQTTGNSPAARRHRVQAGESPSTIARHYGVKLEALLSANPGLNPRRLQIGQTLNVPAS